MSWRHFKRCVKNIAYLKKFINIANACIELRHWPSHFKVSTTIIIPKSNKESYNTSKVFHPIILLNIIEKSFEKVIRERLQFHAISNNFIYQCQLGSLKQWSTINVGITLTYSICSSWARNLITNMLAFNIAQFFPSLNHQILSLILLKAGFDPKVLVFFQDYLIERKTSYFWNNFSSPTFCINMSVDQESVLSLVLSAWYFFLLLHIFENWLKNLKISVFTLLFINNGLFISQNNSLTISNLNLFYSYHIMTSLLKKFGLIIKYGKTEVFHFSRLHSSFDLLPLDLITWEGPILCPKTTWQYLRFIFDSMLIFMLTKWYQPSSAWKCLVTLQKASFILKKGFYTDIVSYLSYFMVFNCGTITKHYFCTLLNYSKTCKEELCYR